MARKPGPDNQFPLCNWTLAQLKYACSERDESEAVVLARCEGGGMLAKTGAALGMNPSLP